MECAGNGRVPSSRRSSASPGCSRPWERRAGAARRSPRCSRRPASRGRRRGAVHRARPRRRGRRGAGVRAEPSARRGARRRSLLAYEVNGAPLPPQHGFPLRLIVPGWYGMTSVKWLARITVLDEPFEGYQMRQRTASDTRRTSRASRSRRCAALADDRRPAIPDFLTARASSRRGRASRGRAWSGRRRDRGVEV